MSHSVHCVLLVDDDPATNFLHRLAIKDAGQAEQVREALNAQQALDYLRQCTAPDADPDTHPRPDLILLDINMPGLSGWGFLDAFRNAELELNPIISIVTSSANPDDRSKAEADPDVDDFLTKPIEKEHFTALVDRHFS